MSLFRASAAGVRTELDAHRLVDSMKAAYYHQLGASPSPSEVRSWERSLPVLVNHLLEAGLSDIEVLLEHKLPYTSKRVDVVLCGVSPKSGRPSVVLVELKQWTNAHTMAGTDDVLLDEGRSQYRLHPVAQVRGYCDYMADYYPLFSEAGVSLAGLASLHNAHDVGVDSLRAMAPSRRGRLFTADHRGELRDCLLSLLAPEAGVETADLLLTGATKPSKQLLAVAADEVQTREQFVLLDEQQIAFSLVLDAVRRARQSDPSGSSSLPADQAQERASLP